MPSRAGKSPDRHEARKKKPAAKGGKARAAKLSAAQRKAIAKQPAKERWKGEWWTRRKPTERY